MAAPGAKLSYSSNYFRVKVQTTKSICRATPVPPKDLILRAMNKLKGVKNSGQISMFSVYEEEFNKFWNLCKDGPLANEESVEFTLAEGSPQLEGVFLERPKATDKALVNLSISSGVQELQSWHKEWLVYFVNKSITSYGPYRINPAQAHSALLQAGAGYRVTDFPISKQYAEPSPKEAQEKPYSVVANRARKEIVLIVRDVAFLAKNVGLQKITQIVKEASQKVSKQFGEDLEVLEDNLQLGLNQAFNGPEMLGQYLPLTLLAATGFANKKPDIDYGPSDYPGAKLLHVEVSDDGLEARIAKFSNDLYSNYTFTIDELWLQNELRRHGISAKHSKKHLTAVLENAKKRGNLNGMLVATGTPSRGGKQPYLYHSYKDHTVAEETGNKNKATKKTVKTGQLIAMLRYRTSRITGHDVYDREIKPPPNEPFKIKLGPGVVEQQPGCYYAEFEGVPIFEGDNISLSKILIIDSDVSLRTGEINFDGPLEVKGSIESGVEVRATGDIHVLGSIRNAFVHCGGELDVGRGILTGEKGRVHAENGIKAEFIENSKVFCGGDIHVKQAILNSQVISGGSIEVSKRTTGVVAGGTISCRKNVSCPNLGFKNGNRTILNVGVDWQVEISVQIKEARKASLTELQAKERKLLREVMARKKVQMTSKHEKRKEYYQQRLIKIRGLLEKLEVHLERARERLFFDQDSKVFVHGTLHANVDIHVGGEPVHVNTDMAGVALLGKRKHGSKVVPLDVALEMQKREKRDEE